jgi:hypothetical protein
VDSSIRFNVSADTAQFQSGMRQVDATAKSTAAGIKQAFSGVGSLLAGGAVVGAMTGLLKKMDDISDGARRIGISAEEFQKIGNAAALVGTSVEAVNKAMIRAGVAANKAAREGGGMAEAFARASLDPAKFAAAGLEDRIKMVAEAQRAANGDARQMSELFEAIGVKAAGIDFSALAEEMGNVNAASSDTVEALARANDELDKAKQSATIFGATLLKALVIDPAERFGSFLGGAGFKTIKELEEIELRAQAIAQLTSEGLLGGNDAENARLIAERMEEIQNKLKGNKNISAAINEDLDTANNLEKEKTSQLERQQRLLEQQEANRKNSIKDAQFEVELIEAKLRGDKARVAALEEQRDFERAMDQTGSFETAANLAAAKAAERAAQDAERSPATSGGGSSSPSDQSALDALRKAAETDARARANLFRIEADKTRRTSRVSELMDGRFFSTAANTQLRAERNAEKRAQDLITRRSATDALFGADSPLKNMGELQNRFRQENPFGRREDFDRFVSEQAKSETERARETSAPTTGVGAGPAPSSPESALMQTVKQIYEVLTRSDGIHDRLPVRSLA